MKRLLACCARALGRPAALALVWLVRLLSAWVVASPLAATLTAFGGSQHPRGDAILFEPGATWLAEAIRLGFPAFGTELRGTLLTFAFFAWVGLVPLGASMSALRKEGGTPLSEIVSDGVGLLPRFTLLAGATLFLQAAGMGAAVALALAARRALLPSLEERASDLVALSVLGLGLLFAAVVGVAQDLVRAAVVSGESRSLVAIGRGVDALRRSARDVLGAVLATELVGAGALLLAAAVVGALDVSRPAAWRIVAVALVHQVAALTLVVARATWLGRAIELVAVSPEQPACVDTLADSDAPADPSPRPGA